MKIKHKELHRITSTAIIYKKEGNKIKYLITKRSLNKKAFPGKWTVPGGGLETDDYINIPADKNGQWYNAVEKSLRREIKEEVNLEVEKLYYLLDVAFIRPDGVPVIILSYYGLYASGEVILDEDATEFAWVPLDEARGYALIDGILREIKMVEEILTREK
ncbi:MAG: NUDIX domain-containing protein [Patescibacteria group bacterium]